VRGKNEDVFQCRVLHLNQQKSEVKSILFGSDWQHRDHRMIPWKTMIDDLIEDRGGRLSCMTM
jgi:hypothetical protein